MTAFSERLKNLRKAAELTQAQVAEQLHLNKQTISQYELGKREPSYEILERLCDFFNISPDYLIGKSDRTVQLVDPVKYWKKAVRIPVLGNVIAGMPTEAIENAAEYILFEADEPDAYGALQVTGDSMSPEIREGDTVIFHRQDDAATGDLVIALVNGDETTIKKIEKKSSKVTLFPLNPTYEPLIFNKKTKADNLKILGKVVEIRRRY